MPDNPNKRGAPDRSRVSHQKHEIGYLADKHQLPRLLVEKIVKQVGPSRTAVETKLRDMKRNGQR